MLSLRPTPHFDSLIFDLNGTLSVNNHLVPGASEALQALSRRVPLFLVSNAHHQHFVSFIENESLGSYFTEICCLGYPKASKQANFEYLINKHNLRRPISIGDTSRDQIASYLAGAHFVFASYGFGEKVSSCPEVNSLGDLAHWLTQPTSEIKLRCRPATNSDFRAVENYYEKVGYHNKIGQDEKIYLAETILSEQIIGAVRLTYEEQCWVLRGMQISPDFQFFGVGIQLLSELLRKNSQEIWCLPHKWLANFYGNMGFQVVPLNEGPQFLSDRINQLRVDWPHLIRMKKKPSQCDG